MPPKRKATKTNAVKKVEEKEPETLEESNDSEQKTEQKILENQEQKDDESMNCNQEDDDDDETEEFCLEKGEEDGVDKELQESVKEEEEECHEENDEEIDDDDANPEDHEVEQKDDSIETEDIDCKTKEITAKTETPREKIELTEVLPEDQVALLLLKQLKRDYEWANRKVPIGNLKIPRTYRKDPKTGKMIKPLDTHKDNLSNAEQLILNKHRSNMTMDVIVTFGPTLRFKVCSSTVLAAHCRAFRENIIKCRRSLLFGKPTIPNNMHQVVLKVHDDLIPGIIHVLGFMHTGKLPITEKNFESIVLTAFALHVTSLTEKVPDLCKKFGYNWIPLPKNSETEQEKVEIDPDLKNIGGRDLLEKCKPLGTVRYLDELPETSLVYKFIYVLFKN